MLIDEIKKSRLLAMKNHDEAAKNILGILLSRYSEKAAANRDKEITDADLVNMIKKLSKELDEEKIAYEEAGRIEQAKEIALQKEVLSPYIPAMMSEEEIRKIIDGLEDKSIKAVMAYFKSNYPTSVDMGLVSKVARGV